MWDLGNAAVIPECQNSSSSIMMFRAVFLAAQAHNVDHFISVIDKRPLRLYRDIIGLDFVPLAGSEPAPYIGDSVFCAVYGNVSNLFEKLNSRLSTVKSGLAKSMIERLTVGVDDKSIVLDQKINL